MTPTEAISLFDSVTTWFFETARFEHSGTLIIRMVGGSRTGKKSSVAINEKNIGPYDEVSPLPDSLVVDVTFSDVWIYDIAREGCERIPEGRRTPYSNYLQEIPENYFDHLLSNPLMKNHYESFELRRWFLWTEDFVVYAICKNEPDISISSDLPNLQIKRGTTYFA